MILQLKLDSQVFMLEPGAVRFYFYLLSQAVDYKVLLSKLPDPVETDTWMKCLLDAAVIGHNTAGPEVSWCVELGNAREGLLANAVNPFRASLVQLQPSDYALRNRSRVPAALLQRWDFARWLMEQPGKIKGLPEVLTIWEGVYCLVFQEEPREFMSKDRGQMSTLFKLYGPVKTGLLIVQYLQKARIPTVGELLFKKDAYFHSLIDQKAKDHAASHSTTGGFF